MNSRPDIYLFQHVPKCGGRSVVRALSHRLDNLHDTPGNHHYPSAEQVAAFSRSRPDLSALERPTLVHGHLVRDGVRPLERYPDHIATGRCRLITFVREPLEHAISAYYYRRRRYEQGELRAGPPGSLEEWLERRENKIARFLLGRDRAGWREYLDRFFFVGVTDQMQRSLDVFGIKSGLHPLPAEHVNATPRPAYTISPGQQAAFQERNPLDYAIYAYACQRLADEPPRPQPDLLDIYMDFPDAPSRDYLPDPEDLSR